MRKSYVVWTLIFGELLIVYVLFFLAYFARINVSELWFLHPEFGFVSVAWMIPYMLFSIFPLYLFRFNLNRYRFKQQLGKSILIVAAILLFLFTMTVLLRKFATSRSFLVLFGVVLLVTLITERFFVARIRRYYLKKGYDRDYIMVVGDEYCVTEYLRRLKDERERIFETTHVCYLDKFTDYVQKKGFTVVSLEHVEQALSAATVDEVHIVMPDMRIKEEVEEVIRLCNEYGVTVRISPIASSEVYDNLVFDKVANRPTFTVAHSYDKEFQLLLKRLFDVLSVLVLLALLSPVLLVCSVAVALSGKGPVIYKHTRVGMNGRRFNMYKFRTMKEEVAPEQVQFYGPFLKVNEDDPRITKAGRWLRKLSLDELPQLINVLKGDLSLVGPRPILEAEAKYLNRKDRKRFRMRPGITGLWQVSGRSNISAENRIKLDIEYVENWSVVRDFKILLKTIPAVLSARGAK